MYRSLPRIQWSSTVKRSSFRSKRVWRRVERGGKKREGGEARDLRTPRLPANGRNGARLALALTLAGETLHSHWLRSLARSRIARSALAAAPVCVAATSHTLSPFTHIRSAISPPCSSFDRSLTSCSVARSRSLSLFPLRDTIVRRCSRYLTDNWQTTSDHADRFL